MNYSNYQPSGKTTAFSLSTITLKKDTIIAWLKRWLPLNKNKSTTIDTDEIPLKDLESIGIIDLIYKKRGSKKISDRPQIKSPKNAYKICMHYWDQNKIELVEEFKVLYLNRDGRVLEILPLATGGINEIVADPRLILIGALRTAATSLILVHNHPSGNLTPSRRDINLTNKVQNAASYIDVHVLDHLIITTDKYFSLADEGLFVPTVLEER